MRDYNFFESYQKKRSVSVDIKSPIALGIIAIILILVVTGGLFARNIVLGANFALLTKELTEIQASDEYQKAQVLQNSIAALSQYDQDAGTALTKIEQGDILNTKFMLQLSNTIPSNVSIITANLTQSSANFVFRVPDRKSAAELFDNLNQSGLFLNITLESINSDSENPGYTAQISGVIKAGDK